MDHNNDENNADSSTLLVGEVAVATAVPQPLPRVAVWLGIQLADAPRISRPLGFVLFTLASVAVGFPFNWIFEHTVPDLGDWLNLCTTYLNLLFPFVCLSVYLRRGSQSDLIRRFMLDFPQHAGELQRYRRYHLVGLTISYPLFVVYWVFLFQPWVRSWGSLQYWAFFGYCLVSVTVMGWWTMWLCSYCYTCSVHGLFVSKLIESIRSLHRGEHGGDGLVHDADEFRKKVTSCMLLHQQIVAGIELTSSHVGGLLSFGVLYHSLDILVYTYAFFTSAYFSQTPVYQWYIGVLWDVISIAMKMAPACSVAAKAERLPKECAAVLAACGASARKDNRHAASELLQHTSACYQRIAFHLAGYRMTGNVAVRIFATLLPAIVYLGLRMQSRS